MLDTLARTYADQDSIYCRRQTTNIKKMMTMFIMQDGNGNFFF